MDTPTYMYTQVWKRDGHITYSYAIDTDPILSESGSMPSIEILAEEYTKEIKRAFGDDFQGRLLVVWQAPKYLQDVLDASDADEQSGGLPSTFKYGIIEPSDRRRIQELLPDGVEIDLE